MGNVAQYVLDNPDSVKDMAKDIRAWVKKSASETMNQIAFQARLNIIEKASQSMIVRNKFLTSPRVLSVTKVPFGHTESLKDIQASVGFTEDADFMRRQDEGGWHTPKEPAKKLKIFTDAAKEGRLPTRHLGKRGKLTLHGKVIHTILFRRGRYQSPKANRVARAFMAYKTGLLMYLGPNRNLFKVTDFQARGGEVQFQTKMFINRAFEKTFTPAKNFFLPACQEAAKDMQKLFNEAMDRNMNSH
jgi:hypothetical protein